MINRENFSIYDKTDKVGLLIPRPFDRRIVAQGAVLTYHYDVCEPLKCEEGPREIKQAAPEGVNLVRIRVAGKGKALLQRQLSDLGISRKSLFPDLEGLSAFINWGYAAGCYLVGKSSLPDRQRPFRPEESRPQFQYCYARAMLG